MRQRRHEIYEPYVHSCYIKTRRHEWATDGAVNGTLSGALKGSPRCPFKTCWSSSRSRLVAAGRVPFRSSAARLSGLVWDFGLFSLNLRDAPARLARSLEPRRWWSFEWSSEANCEAGRRGPLAGSSGLSERGSPSRLYPDWRRLARQRAEPERTDERVLSARRTWTSPK